VTCILLLNLGSDSLKAATESLAGQGYDIATENGLTADEVLALSTEVLVTEATPSDLSCCGLIAQLKSQPETESSLKVVMIVHGGALERARALDLGADDVISFPFEPVEFAARIRTQFRERRPKEELKTMLKYAVQREHYADIALESLSAGAAGKRRFWLIPAILMLSAAAAVLPAVVTVVSGRHTRKDSLQLQAEIARLNSGLGQEGELLRHAEQARGSIEARSPSAARNSLKAQSARADSDVAQKIASGTQDLSQMMSQLASQRLIRPITTQGHIGDVLENKIVYDAATTSGGSGGPLFNVDGKVIGINFAVLKGFGGSNLAVPARYATELLAN